MHRVSSRSGSGPGWSCDACRFLFTYRFYLISAKSTLRLKGSFHEIHIKFKLTHFFSWNWFSWFTGSPDLKILPHTPTELSRDGSFNRVSPRDEFNRQKLHTYFRKRKICTCNYMSTSACPKLFNHLGTHLFGFFTVLAYTVCKSFLSRHKTRNLFYLFNLLIIIYIKNLINAILWTI